MPKLEVVAAFDRALIDSVEMQTTAEVDAALTLADRTARDRANWLPVWKRFEILERAAGIMKSRAEDLARQSAREGGKPLMDSRVEVARGIEGVKTAIAELGTMRGEEVPMGLTPSSANRLAFTHREPRGVATAISAFNHPFNLIIHQVIPAVAVGCPVIVKPALTTPLSCRNIVNILYEAGLPKAWAQMVVCENEGAAKLVSDPRVSFFSFIGSAKVGWYLRSQLAPGAVCTLEHGGAAPVIIDASADLEAAVASLVKGGYYHAGQVCVSVQRIFVDQAVCQRFCELFTEKVKALKVGDPLSDTTEVGPLILPREVDRVHAWIEEASASGKLLCGGKRLSATTYAPSVVLDPRGDCKLATMEVFGPATAVFSYRDRSEAIARANALDVAFQAAVFSKDIDVALDTARRLDGMAVMINDHTAFRVDWMPFGGYRQSGLGVGGIGQSMREMTREKMIVFKSAGL